MHIKGCSQKTEPECAREKQGMWDAWLSMFAMSLVWLPVALGDDPFCSGSGNCYTIQTALLSFYKANMTCGSNGYLASMKTQQEHAEILELLTQHQDKGNITSTFWLGLHVPSGKCIGRNKELYGFVWISGGEDTQVSAWEDIPQPSCTIKRKCVILKMKKDAAKTDPGAPRLVWRNGKCDRPLASICRSNEPVNIFPKEDIQVVTHPPTDNYTPRAPTTYHQTEILLPASETAELCKGFWGNVTSTCEVNITYVCNGTHCSCGNVNHGREHDAIRKCKNTQKICVEECIKSSKVFCLCAPCVGEECSTNGSVSVGATISPSTVLNLLISTSAPPHEGENLMDQLVIPLILGLVAFGILVMLVWGGVQMCVRKKKPTRRKSIIPAPPDMGSETDSTDHSSSEEDDEEDEDEEEGEGEENQQRTDNP